MMWGWSITCQSHSLTRWRWHGISIVNYGISRPQTVSESYYCFTFASKTWFLMRIIFFISSQISFNWPRMEFVPRSQNRKNANHHAAQNMLGEGKSFIFTANRVIIIRTLCPVTQWIKVGHVFGYIILGWHITLHQGFKSVKILRLLWYSP